MLIQKKTTKTQSRVPAEGLYEAELKSVKCKTNKASEPNGVELVLELRGEGVDGYSVSKHYASVGQDERSPLWKDLGTLRGKPLGPDEMAQGLDPDTLVGAECQVIVAHKSGVGGSLQAVACVLMPAMPPGAAQTASA